MADQDWSVSIFNLGWVVQDDYLSKEFLNFFRGIVDSTATNQSSFEVFSIHVFDGESYIVSREGFRDWLIIFLNRHNLWLDIWWGKADIHSKLEYTSLYPADCNCSDPFDFIDVLNR